MVRIDDTSDATFDALFAFGKAMNKEPVACKVFNLATAVRPTPQLPRIFRNVEWKGYEPAQLTLLMAFNKDKSLCMCFKMWILVAKQPARWHCK